MLNLDFNHKQAPLDAPSTAMSKFWAFARIAHVVFVSGAPSVSTETTT
jgi:hypothetical protein